MSVQVAHCANDFVALPSMVSELFASIVSEVEWIFLKRISVPLIPTAVVKLNVIEEPLPTYNTYVGAQDMVDVDVMI